MIVAGVLPLGVEAPAVAAAVPHVQALLAVVEVHPVAVEVVVVVSIRASSMS